MRCVVSNQPESPERRAAASEQEEPSVTFHPGLSHFNAKFTPRTSSTESWLSAIPKSPSCSWLRAPGESGQMWESRIRAAARNSEYRSDGEALEKWP
ncbi:hypothetical protein AAFF_G00154890 [Aldrovandia affinis]|uniref:Uncharacterized protein n=1 Tax=Aldrovandia affinis TaxID=143900 RepID=A0AAD7WW76_9TELE|nr:hypothetical protein AAFF_G00154890 [Aldrovandia affinis]